jgi:UDP-N-acetylmuramoyl-tripeptide--D-alanyl-D-alanine ligase
MIPMTLSEVARLVGGQVDGDPDVLVDGPAFLDSREPEPGGLFVAFAGERVDGHEYAAGAVRDGAAAVLGSRSTGVPAVLVPDVQEALARLARAVLDRLPGATVLALTGSQGKTGTKDYLAQVLATAGPTVATRGNLNNEIGVPLTVLGAGPETSHLVVEMGARGIGHVADLCRIAPPDVAAVLNVGTAHVGEFGSQDAIAVAKGEIVESLRPDGVAVLNADDPRVAAMAARTRARVLTVGSGEDCELRWEDLVVDELGRPSATLRHRDARAPLRLRQVGAHQVANAAMAAGMALAAGLDLVPVAAALSAAESRSRWRMETTRRGDGVVVVNDAYNANPASTVAALDAVAAMAATSAGARGGRTGGRPRLLAVLGEMRELGDAAAAEHRAVGAHAARVGVDRLVVVGVEAAPVAEGARSEPGWAGSVVVAAGREEALEDVRNNVRAGDVVLVKASRGVALERLAEALVSDVPPTEEGDPTR